ncbi:SsgA family sporulation/cell division regulator [Streptomyces sp. CB01373]|uniref:SsgA family sporulation/cell division regulator n=1 Tax=Streptomyces sp. CB01373 TaxID=2020325 RepID=UPI000C279021|nr:SsgA family sporulation/cell division regulator [Streptomyces sp. CB01373]PJM93041.1 cell division protein [Streptomyces sp. CB01373]
MSVVEQHARAHIFTEDVPDDVGAVPVVLRYDSLQDPRAVMVDLPGPHEWTFPRSLLEQGLRAPAGSGDVRVWPCGRVQAVIEFHSTRGVSVVQLDTKAVLRFLKRTYRASPAAVAHG